MAAYHYIWPWWELQEMKTYQMISRRVCALLFVLVMSGLVMTGQAMAEARTLIWNMDNLNLAKQLWEQGDPSVVPAVEHILDMSDSRIASGIDYSVTYKETIPDGLTAHDYFTTCHYCWPNPDTEDGLPWIGIDGLSNPDSAHDGTQLQGLASDVQALSLAYFMTGDQAYSDRATELLRVFFLNPETYMKPEVRYASGIPGATSGRFSVAGIGNQFRRLFDPITLLEGSPSWTAADDAGMKQWASDFRDFMWNDPVGIAEQAHKDNHGTNYDMISALLSLYLGDEDSAHAWILNYKDKMDLQYNPDGTQYYPLLRADSQVYHEYNLRIASDIAEMADRFDDIDLWSFVEEDGGSMVNSIDFLIPYFTGQKTWDLWPTDRTFAAKNWNWYRMWLRAANNLDDPTYLTYADMTRIFDANGFDYDVYNLLYPAKGAALAGDLNADGVVGLDDLQIILDYWNINDPADPRADINGDGYVGLDDLQVILDQWQGEPTPPEDTVPEPAGVGVLMLSAWLLGRRRTGRSGL